MSVNDLVLWSWNITESLNNCKKKVFVINQAEVMGL